MIKNKIYCDVMGTDLGYKTMILAAVDFYHMHPAVKFIFFGPKKALASFLATQNLPSENYEIFHAPDVIEQTGNILDIRRKKASSMVKALTEFQKSGAKHDFIISAGNTASFTAGCYFILKMIPGFKRIGMMVFIPTYVKNKFLLMLDAGSNLKNDALDLVDYAFFAHLFLQQGYHFQNPKVALLNVGTEKQKGDDVLKEVHQLLQKDKRFNFVGNIEGREILSGHFDIVVTDGYAGNMTIKAMEGVFKYLVMSLKKEFKKNIFRKVMAFFFKKVFRDVKETYNYKNYGGSIVVGTQKLALKCHGSSDVKSFLSAFNIGLKTAQSNLIGDLTAKMKVSVVSPQIKNKK